MPSSRGLFCRAFGLAAALAALPAAAQEPPTASAAPAAPAAAAPESASEGRVLNGHVFQPSVLVTGPFTTTSFVTQIILIAGSTSASVTIGDQDISGSLDYAGLGGYAGYEYAFLKHFSARLWLNDVVFSGLTGRAVVVMARRSRAGSAVG